MQLRSCEMTNNDWNNLMTRTVPSNVSDLSSFDDVLHLFPPDEAMVNHNIIKLHSYGQPVISIKAVHTGANVSKVSPDDAGGLHPIVCLTKGARLQTFGLRWVL